MGLLGEERQIYRTTIQAQTCYTQTTYFLKPKSKRKEISRGPSQQYVCSEVAKLTLDLRNGLLRDGLQWTLLGETCPQLFGQHTYTPTTLMPMHVIFLSLAGLNQISITPIMKQESQYTINGRNLSGCASDDCYERKPSREEPGDYLKESNPLQKPIVLLKQLYQQLQLSQQTPLEQAI